jgi:AraC family transcriptional regulator
LTRFRAVLDSITEHRDAAVTLRELAAVVHRGPSPFARTFPAPTALPPHRSVVVRPVERAKQIQRGGDDFSLAQVAARSGSRDQGHFTVHLTRLVGVTPKHFR